MTLYKGPHRAALHGADAGAGPLARRRLVMITSPHKVAGVREAPGRWERACPAPVSRRPDEKDALWSTIGEALDAFPETECQNYLANSGYEFT